MSAVVPVPSNRARGTLAASFVRAGARTEVVGPFETGGYRLRMPRRRDGICEAVVVNTGGGMAGGDRVAFAFDARAGASVALTTAAAEKVYRGADAAGLAAETGIEVALTAAADATLDWLPQETILFDGARLDRRMTVDMAEGAELVVAEMLVFGRLAMGERVSSGALRDRWRIRRDGRLILAEDLALDGDIAGLLDRPALGGGARASATVLLVAPAAEGRLDRARAALADAAITAGISAWDGLLVVRMVSAAPDRLRAAVAAVLHGMRDRALPRLWG